MNKTRERCFSFYLCDELKNKHETVACGATSAITSQGIVDWSTPVRASSLPRSLLRADAKNSLRGNYINISLMD